MVTLILTCRPAIFAEDAMTQHNPARFSASPRSQGYCMPAEYAPHKRSWMMWPCRPEVWPDMAATKRDYALVAQAIDTERLRRI